MNRTTLAAVAVLLAGTAHAQTTEFITCTVNCVSAGVPCAWKAAPQAWRRASMAAPLARL